MKEIFSYSKSTTISVIFKPCSCSHDLSNRYILENLKATTYQMVVCFRFVTILFFLGLSTGNGRPSSLSSLLMKLSLPNGLGVCVLVLIGSHTSDSTALGGIIGYGAEECQMQKVYLKEYR